ncbi:MAG: methanogenesis marker 12 protein [Candidatus Hydrothermarchaeales archaeon]
MNTLGIDHGTQSIRFCALGSDGQVINFEIGRKEAAKRSILEEIKKRVPFSIDMVGVTYSMGDAINAVVDLHKVEGRGVLKESTGNFIGGGTKVFDEIYNSDLNAVLIPGLHKGIECLDPRFRALYSHCAASEKVSLGYHIFLEVNKTATADDLIISDISSNTVTIGIKDGKFFGAIDACLGAAGLLHGPLDLETIRKVDDGEITANEAFYTSGAMKILKGDPKDIFDPKNETAKLALDCLILSVTMEIFGFLGAFEPEAIVITGSAGVNDKVYNALRVALERFGRVQKINGYSAARGSAEIALSVLKGQKDILGIPVEF